MTSFFQSSHNMSTSNEEEMANILKEEKEKLLAEISNKIKKRNALENPDSKNELLN